MRRFPAKSLAGAGAAATLLSCASARADQPRPWETGFQTPATDMMRQIEWFGNYTFVFIVDHIALTHPDHPIQVVDLYTEPGRVFRVIPSEMWAVQNNLSIANMDFEDFADAVDQDGIFRGFPGS